MGFNMDIVVAHSQDFRKGHLFFFVSMNIQGSGPGGSVDRVGSLRAILWRLVLQCMSVQVCVHIGVYIYIWMYACRYARTYL